MNNSPIGVFDSGMGGLSVASEILKVLPEESVAYFADFAHVPYGERPYSEIRSFALAISEFLVSRGAKAIVMACNVSSAVAMDTVRERFPRIPVIGMIKSGAKAAVAAAAGKPVGVLATTGTIKSKAYDAEIAKLAPEIPVFGVGCPRFVPLVEAGKTHSHGSRPGIRRAPNKGGVRHHRSGLHPLPLPRGRRKSGGAQSETHQPRGRSGVIPQANIGTPGSSLRRKNRRQILRQRRKQKLPHTGQ